MKSPVVNASQTLSPEMRGDRSCHGWRPAHSFNNDMSPVARLQQLLTPRRRAFCAKEVSNLNIRNSANDLTPFAA